ncbi:MAG: hypothetical protein AAF456_25955 [Planctomycetota bacterium]
MNTKRCLYELLVRAVLLPAVFLFSCGCSSLVFADDLRIVWDNNDGDLLFTNPNNWGHVTLPIANNTLPGTFVDSGDTTNAIIQNGDSVNLTSNFTAANQFDILIVRFNSSLNISADLNTANSPILVGQIAGATDAITQTAGTVSASSLSIGDGGGDAAVTYSMSGGALNLSGNLSMTNDSATSLLSLQGDSASITVGSNFAMNTGSTLSMQFGSGGVDAIDVAGTFTVDPSAMLEVDGSAYTGGPGIIDLVKFSNITGAFAEPANVSLTGFSSPVSLGYDSDSLFLSVSGRSLALFVLVIILHNFCGL